MIYPVTMYAGKCDGCQKPIELGGGEYSAYEDHQDVLFEMNESGWAKIDNKHFCPCCFFTDEAGNKVKKTPPEETQQAVVLSPVESAGKWYSGILIEQLPQYVMYLHDFKYMQGLIIKVESWNTGKNGLWFRVSKSDFYDHNADDFSPATLEDFTAQKPGMKYLG